MTINVEQIKEIVVLLMRIAVALEKIADNTAPNKPVDLEINVQGKQ